MSIASEIQRIKDNIEDAYTECENKGATLPQNQNSDNLATTIASISGGGGDLSDYFNTTIDSVSTASNTFVQTLVKKIPPLQAASGITSLEYAFRAYPFKDMAFESLDCSGVSSLNRFCGNSSILQHVDLSNVVNTSNITNLQYMFASNSKLETVDNFFPVNTTSQINLEYIFYSCSSLKRVDLSKTSYSTALLGSAFRATYKMTILDISGFDLNSSQVKSQSYIFQECGRDCLQSDGAYADGIPYVYVKDTASQNWVLGLSSSYRPSTWSTNNVVIKSN